MKIKKGVFGLLLVIAVVVSACGVSAAAPKAAEGGDSSTPEAMMDDKMSQGEGMMEESPAAEAGMEDKTTVQPVMDDEMSQGEGMMEESPAAEAGVEDKTTAQPVMDDEMSEDEGMMGQEAPTGEAMMTHETPTPEAMMEETSMEPEASMAEGGMMTPAWYGVELTDVNSGTTFEVADLKGKVVLVETLAVWCSNCLRQQKEVRALHELLGERDDFVSLGLDIDTNETPEILKTHTNRNGFDWLYAVAPVEVAREIGELYGNQFLNPPSTPMLIIDREGEAHPLPFGIKSAQELQEALGPYLN